jgi:AAA domain
VSQHAVDAAIGGLGADEPLATYYERTILGYGLNGRHSAEVRDHLDLVNADDFSIPAHRHLWAAIAKVAGTPDVQLRVLEELVGPNAPRALNALGNLPGYLSGCVESADLLDLRSVRYCAERVREAARMRRGRELIGELSRALDAGDDDVLLDRWSSFGTLIDGGDDATRSAAAEQQAEMEKAKADRIYRERLDFLRATKAAQRTLAEEEAAASMPEPTSALDWASFLTQELAPPDWHAGRLFGQGEQVAIVGEGKAGKSLLCLEMAWRDAAGLPFLGDKPRRPRRVLYLDHENSQRDIQARLIALGAQPADLANLHYLSFPAHRPLDTEAGAADALAEIERYRAEIVYFDTVSRVVADKENDSTPWLNMYRLLLKEIKRQGISTVRLDHFGKDTERGARGNSAKSQDVDAVWELRVVDKSAGQLALVRSFTRQGVGRDFVRIQRLGEVVDDQWVRGGTTHVLAEGAAGEGQDSGWMVAASVADQLDAAGVPLLSREKTRSLIKEKHPEIKCSNTVLGEALKIREQRQPGAVSE